MSHTSWITTLTTSGLIFTETCLSVSKEWVRSWSHAFLITNDKTVPKKTFGSPSGKEIRKMAIAKPFALNAHAISATWLDKADKK